MRFAFLESHTTWVVTGGEQDATRSLSQSNDVAGSRRRKNSILSNEKLLGAVCSTDLGDQLDDLGVPEAAITTDNKE